MELKRGSSVVVRARGTKADRGWPVLDRWIAATAKDTQSRCCLFPRPLPSVRGLRCSAPPSVPLLPRNEAAVATHRCGRRLLRNHPLGIDFEALFFFFLLMEFGILEGVRCKLLSFRDRFERDWRM